MFYGAQWEKMSSRNVVDLRKKQPGQRKPPSQPQLPLRTGGRVSPVRTRRRRARIIGLCLALAIVVSGALVASYLSYLPRYSIATVTVEGADVVPVDLITSYTESLIYNGSHN